MNILKYFFEVNLPTLIRARESLHFTEEHGIFMPKRYKWKSFWFACLLFFYFSHWNGLGGILNLFHKHKMGYQKERAMLEIIMTAFFCMFTKP